MTPSLFSLRGSSEASAMASHQCCSSGGHSHRSGCVYVPLCEGWKGQEHATAIGKTILSFFVLWCVRLTTRKRCLTGKSDTFGTLSTVFLIRVLMSHSNQRVIKDLLKKDFVDVVFSLVKECFSDSLCFQ